MADKNLCNGDVTLGCLQSIYIINNFFMKIKKNQPEARVNNEQYNDIKNVCESIITKLTKPKTYVEAKQIIKNMETLLKNG